MGNIWVTADTHFGHPNILKYQGHTRTGGYHKPKDIEEHDESLILFWNQRAKPEDTVYHLGDFALAKTSLVMAVLDRLHGKIHLVRGNHDKKMPKKVRDRFESIQDYLEIKVWDEEMDLEQFVVMCHYPMASWNKMHHGAWMLHGHCHDHLDSPSSMARQDVGVDANDGYPFGWEQLKEIMTRKVFVPVDQHGRRREE